MTGELRQVIQLGYRIGKLVLLPWAMYCLARANIHVISSHCAGQPLWQRGKIIVVDFLYGLFA